MKLTRLALGRLEEQLSLGLNCCKYHSSFVEPSLHIHCQQIQATKSELPSNSPHTVDSLKLTLFNSPTNTNLFQWLFLTSC